MRASEAVNGWAFPYRKPLKPLTPEEPIRCSVCGTPRRLDDQCVVCPQKAGDR